MKGPSQFYYAAQFQEQVWKSHQAFTAALANPAGRSSHEHNPHHIK